MNQVWEWHQLTESRPAIEWRIPLQHRCDAAVGIATPNQDYGQTKPIQDLSFCFFFYEANKTTSYVWVLLKKKKKQNAAFYVRFSDSQGYISPYFALNIFQLSLSLSPLKSRLTQNNDKLLRVFSFVCLLILLFFLFICLGKLKAWMIKYLSWFETLNVWLSLAVNPKTH